MLVKNIDIFLIPLMVLEWQHAYVDTNIPPICIEARESLMSGEWLYAGEKDPVEGTNTWQMALPVQDAFFRLSITNAP